MAAPAAVERTLPVLLAFVAGFVDTCGFVAFSGLFSAHVTGNFVLLGAALVQPHGGVIAKMLALPVFILAVAATRLFLVSPDFAGPSANRALGAEFTLLGLFVATSLAAAPVIDADAPLAVLAGMMAVLAMGVQNATARTAFAALSPTTVMTGNVTQVVLDCVDAARAVDERLRGAAATRLAKFAPPIVGFAIGAGMGAWSFGVVGFWCALLPMAVILFLMLRRAPLPPSG